VGRGRAGRAGRGGWSHAGAGAQAVGWHAADGCGSGGGSGAVVAAAAAPRRNLTPHAPPPFLVRAPQEILDVEQITDEVQGLELTAENVDTVGEAWAG
jgi:hypothetical protein